MEINTFAGKVRDAVEKKLGETYKVEVREVQKNNGVILHGLLILTDDRNVIPTLYLEPFWEAYESGTSLAEIVRRLIRIYREDLPKTSIDMEFFRYFEKVSERICYPRFPCGALEHHGKGTAGTGPEEHTQAVPVEM